ncbi:GH3 auxin-responsive promoter family protein [Chloroflexota bacterium]
MLKEDAFFASGDDKAIWTRYCGFLSLSVDEFYHIQQRLLTQQMAELSSSNFHRQLMGERKVANIDDFRQIVPLTRYQDYTSYLQDGQGRELVRKPIYWIYTSAPKGTFKYVPWTERFNDVQCRNIIGALILSSASGSGDIQVRPGCRFLEIAPESPFASGQLARQLMQEFTVTTIPHPEKAKHMAFNKKMEMAIKLALKSDIDFVAGMTSSLIKFENKFARLVPDIMHSPKAIKELHPAVAWRLIRRLGRSDTLPADVWKIKGIFSWGVDTATYARRLEHQWGKKPLELYASSEGGIVAMQDWRHGPLALLPDSVFFEFIPHNLVNTSNPSTILINDVEYGEVYEPVITQFYGMPLMRYRQGDLIRFLPPDDNTDFVPRMEFVGRADDLVDIFGISRITTDTLVEALTRTGISHDEWFLTSGIEHDKLVLRLYTEKDGATNAAETKRRLSRELRLIDRHWAEAIYTMGYNPLQIELVSPGTFRLLGGAQKLAHINPPESMVQRLSRLIKGEP